MSPQHSLDAAYPITDEELLILKNEKKLHHRAVARIDEVSKVVAIRLVASLDENAALMKHMAPISDGVEREVYYLVQYEG